MIPYIKIHLPVVAIVLLSALVTFSILWARDVVRIIEPSVQANTLSPVQTVGDPEIERILASSDSINPDAIESDLRSLDLHAIGEELIDIQTILETQP